MTPILLEGHGVYAHTYDCLRFYPSFQVVVRLSPESVYESEGQVPLETWFPRNPFRFKVAASKRVTNLVRRGGEHSLVARFPLPPHNHLQR
jgi:hypothetical protein